MKTFNHVLISWLLSVFFMLFIAFGYEYYRFDSGNLGELFGMEAFTVLLYSLLCAIPSLVISWVLLVKILRIQCLPAEKFLLWCLSGVVAVSVNIVLPLLFFFPEEIVFDTFFFFWPAYTGTMLTILVRSKRFLSLIKKLQHENNLV